MTHDPHALPPGLAPPPARQTVLAMDDIALNLAILQGWLEPDCEVMVASTEISALRLAAEHLPDLILLDAQMPGMGGFEVCRRLKADPLTAAIPVIFLTALSDPEAEAKGLEIGAIDYIVKPFNGAVLRARVRNHLKLVRQSIILERLAQLDGLTGIANRRAFDTFLQQQWRQQETRQQPLTVFLMDVDYFKPYNDTLGHLAGDQCLQRVAQAIADVRLRSSGLVARYGGEEFAYVLPDVGYGDMLQIGERIRSAVKDLAITHPSSPVCKSVTLSIGCATLIPTADLDSRVLVDEADQCLYQAKQAGRDCVVGKDLERED